VIRPGKVSESQITRGGSPAMDATTLPELSLAYHGSMAGEWTFLSNYGHVLVCLAGDPDARMRDVAEVVGITERAVQQIVRDLVEQGYVRKDKVGRRNRYQVVGSAHFRHALEADLTLDRFLALVVDGTPSQPRRELRSSAGAPG
jgi:DNA-binding MarR family transcriptional regulator